MHAIICSIITVLNVLCDIESGNRPNAVGDGGRAIGILQIRQECLDDCNRFAGTAYSLDDMRRPAVARAMCAAYLRHYGEAFRRAHGRKATDVELARMWNGGPRGYAKRATLPYAAKARARGLR